MSDLNDWSNYLIQAEINFKKIELKLNDRDYHGITDLADKIVENLNKTILWAEEEIKKVEQDLTYAK
jgi:hypothetical protein